MPKRYADEFKRDVIAVARHGDVAGCILHTDTGSKFRSRKHIRELHHHEMVGSMGRVSAAGDNAAMESFFALFKYNALGACQQGTGAWVGDI